MGGILHKISPILTAVGLAICTVGCSKEKEETVTITPPAVIFSLPAPGEAPFRNFPGEVTSEDNLRISFEVPGRLVHFPVYDGKVVEAGDLIGRLDQADFRAAFDAAQARATSAQQEFDRATTLRQRNVISQSELDQRREALDVTQADLRTAQRALTDTQLFAPIKGRISRRFVRNHQNIQAREPVVLLQNISTLDIEVQIPEALMASISANTTAAEANKLVEAEVEFAAVPGDRFPLTLRSFSTQANPSSRTFPVTFVLRPPADRNILPGMTCTVGLRFRNPDGTPVVQAGIFQIPVRALLTAEGKPWVWRWDAKTGNVSRLPVEMVALTGEYVQVRAEGLKAGDELVASGVRFLSEGDTVSRMESRQP
jgi:membrane fusion protein, multidrug efflux system